MSYSARIRRPLITALMPGDLIYTGTPQGVGDTMTPPQYLQPGDVRAC